MRTPITPIALTIAALLLAACGGGGGEPAAPSVPSPSVVPTAKILFPCPVSLTTAEVITVRGTCEDVRDVVTLEVNGVPAISSNGFRQWRARVPLAPGDNSLQVDVRLKDSSGAGGIAAAEVKRVPALLNRPRSVDRDPASGRIFAYDAFEGLVAFDPASSEWEIISRPSAPVEWTLGGAFDPTTNAYYQILGESPPGEIVRIDLATGARTPVVGSGPALPYLLRDIDVDGLGNAYIVGTDPAIGGGGRLLRVDLTTGERFEVSSDAVGSGPTLFTANALHISDDGASAYVYDSGNRALILVDLATGDRSALLDPTLTTFNMPGTIQGLVVDAANSCAYVGASGWIAKLDWAAATVTQAIGGTSFHGILGSVQHLAPGPGGALIAVDQPSLHVGWSGLSSIDLASRTLTPYTDTRIGSTAGPEPTRAIEDLVVDTAGRRLVMLDKAGGIHELMMGDGSRTVLSNDSVGSGPVFDHEAETIALGTANTAYVGSATTLYEVDLPTGARVAVTDAAPELQAQGGIAWDPTTSRVLAGTDVDDLLMRVDPTTGDRALVTSDALYELHDLDLDGARNRLYLLTEDAPSSYVIMTADLTTGVLSPLLALNDDPGDELEFPDALAADAVTGRVFVLEDEWIFELDPLRGSPRLVTNLQDVGRGAALGIGFGMAAAPRDGVLFIGTPGSVTAVDAETGERVVIAK